jgi:hypothetical protein
LQISIQRCDMDGDNRLRVCQSACQSYNKACGARLDCSDRTLFSGEEGYGSGTCTGDGTTEAWLQLHLRTLLLAGLLIAITGFFLATIRYICQTLQTSGSGVIGDSMHDLHGPYVVITEGEFEGGWSGTGRRKPLGTFCSLPMEPLLSLFMHKTSRLPSRHLLSDILLMHTQQLHPHRATRGVESMLEEGNWSFSASLPQFRPPSLSFFSLQGASLKTCIFCFLKGLPSHWQSILVSPETGWEFKDILLIVFTM